MARGNLRDYHAKRDFERTAEPKGVVGKRKRGALRYLIQKHAARRLHYDFRLEWNGTLLSWAVPKGPSENPDDKRLAVHVEDHPIEYGDFEGTIPQGQYGGGTVMLWDQGTWEPNTDDVDAALAGGKLSFALHGKRLKGNWALVRLRARSPKDKDNWLLIKEHDEYECRSGAPIIERETASVKSGRAMQEIAAGRAVWHSDKSNGASRKKATMRKAAAPKKTAARGGSKKKSSSARLPAFVAPQLATLVDEPPASRDWLHEMKIDGYRIEAAVAGERVVFYTRNGLDWTPKFGNLAAPLSRLDCRSALIDGEMAVQDAQGRPDFGALQNALSGEGGPILYYVFDLLALNGVDLRKEPLIRRKEKLKVLVADVDPRLVYSDEVRGDGEAFFTEVCKLRLEGIVSKRADAPYRSGRGGAWLKCKCGHEQEFVVIGWRPSTKPLRPFSSLLLAVREKGTLRYAGRVGSGYSGAGLENLSKQFRALARKTSPAAGVPGAIARQACFLEPKLVAEIAFRDWTHDGLVRQGSFKGLRSDKPASEIVREKPVPAKRAERAMATSARAAKKTTRGHAAPAVKPARDGAEEIAGVRVTHPDRVLFAAQDVTKRELIAHYLSVADRILPHISGRPISIVRCPQGSGKQCFFQKHASDGFPDAFRPIRIREKSGSADYFYIEDERGLVAAVQVGVLELHLWGCHVDDIEAPDRMIFDFDPDEGLDFAHVAAAAKDMRARLRDLGLESFPMVTGGKGVHVVAPLRRGHSWDEHRDFAEALARVMAQEEPDRFVANMSKAKRRGKIFVDYLRNQRGATAICPFSTRARPGAYVAMPVSWQKLARLDMAHPVRVGEATKYLGRGDPWPDYFKLRQALPRLKG
jgi:bifunctional non-homologous end joining protein LigD